MYWCKTPRLTDVSPCSDLFAHFYSEKLEVREFATLFNILANLLSTTVQEPSTPNAYNTDDP